MVCLATGTERILSRLHVAYPRRCSDDLTAWQEDDHEDTPKQIAFHGPHPGPPISGKCTGAVLYMEIGGRLQVVWPVFATSVMVNLYSSSKRWYLKDNDDLLLPMTITYTENSKECDPFLCSLSLLFRLSEWHSQIPQEPATYDPNHYFAHSCSHGTKTIFCFCFLHI
jgi:hypothetical protein